MAKNIRTGDCLISIGEDVLEVLKTNVEEAGWSQIVVIADENTAVHCWPILASYFPGFPLITLEAGEQNKRLQACESVWKALTEMQADRATLVLNLGGGMVGDIGGFAAACYKRGLDFIQIPTSLLAMVDASVGGKTGVNFQGFKNQVGLFKDPQSVFVLPTFLKTLPNREIKSGFAEMIKHCLIADKEGWNLLRISSTLPSDWEPLIISSIQIKAQIVEQDPFEAGPRKALNFGHTVGHAVESHFLYQHPERALLHGEAVAVGMICETFLSAEEGLLSPADRDSISQYLSRIYGQHTIPEKELAAIAKLAMQDKKNKNGQILCTLLNGIGDFKINCNISEAQVMESLDYYRHL